MYIVVMSLALCPPAALLLLLLACCGMPALASPPPLMQAVSRTARDPNALAGLPTGWFEGPSGESRGPEWLLSADALKEMTLFEVVAALYRAFPAETSDIVREVVGPLVDLPSWFPEQCIPDIGLPALKAGWFSFALLSLKGSGEIKLGLSSESIICSALL